MLPAAMERVRRKLASADDGNRQMVDILSAVLTDGLPVSKSPAPKRIAHGCHLSRCRPQYPGPPA